MKAYHSDAEQHTRNPTAEDDAQLCYRNAEGYPDPTAYHALRSAMKKSQPAKKDRPPRTQVAHYDRNEETNRKHELLTAALR